MREIEDWDDKYVQDFFEAGRIFCVQYLYNEGVKVTAKQMDDVAKSVVPEEKRDKMGTFFLDCWREEVLKEGEERGKTEGKIEGKIEELTDWFTEVYGPESNALREKVAKIQDLEILKSLLKAMRKNPTLEEIEQKVEELLAENPDAIDRE